MVVTVIRIHYLGNYCLRNNCFLYTLSRKNWTTAIRHLPAAIGSTIINNLKPQTIYRKDYKPSSHLIKTTELEFELKDDETIVSSRISFYKNPKVSKSPKELFLNGDSLELLSIKIDEKEGNYELKDDGLLLINPPESFILETIVRIHPERKTNLNEKYIFRISLHNNNCGLFG